ncbi:MAG: Mth938-like domain-containing protein [Rickettsiales bacterium]
MPKFYIGVILNWIDYNSPPLLLHVGDVIFHPMDITPLTPKEKKRIRSYGAQIFRVNDDAYSRSIAVTPDAVYLWEPLSLGAITPESVQSLPNSVKKADVLLLGAGKRYAPLSAEAKNAFAAAGMTPETMDLGAACRTYNVLLSEERNVAALLIVSPGDAS